MEIKFGLVSCDSHAQLDRDAWSKRMSKEKWRDRIPQIVEVTENDCVVDHWMINGKVFDQHNGATFPAGQLIPGWVEALSLMKEGDSWELVVPSDLGYGPDGAGGDIPPNQTLVFDMTLLKVKPAQ